MIALLFLQVFNTHIVALHLPGRRHFTALAIGAFHLALYTCLLQKAQII